MTRRRRDYRRRQGTTLVLFAILIFALLPMMALVLDLGIVRVTRRQMQTAANAAAIEGLRHRDDPTEDRRELARNMTQGMPAGPASFLRDTPTPTLTGNSFRVSPRIDLNADQLPIVTQFHANLELNADNKQHGDLVAGEYNRDAAVDPDALFTEKTDTSGMTPEYYKRSDFTAADVADAATARSFLARLRRTPLHDNSTEPDDEAGVSSAGPPVPFVFGRGGLASGGTPDPHALWNQRETGVTVRATSIADARPALTVGPAILADMYFDPIEEERRNPLTLGLAPFAVNTELWEALPAAIEIDAQGRITLMSSSTEKGFVRGLAKLASDIDATTTQMTVVSGVGWSWRDPNLAETLSFIVRVDNELIRVVDVSSNGLEWTIERGLNNTVASEHDADAFGHMIVAFETLKIGDSMVAQQQRCVRDPLDPRALLPEEQRTLLMPEQAYVPIYESIPNVGNRVIGFGWIAFDEITLDMNTVFATMKYVANPHDPTRAPIAPENASAQIGRLGDEWTDSESVNELFRRRMSPALEDRILLAPALVRTLGKLKNP